MRPSMGDMELRDAAGSARIRTCSRADARRTAAGGESGSTPRRRIVLPTCSRQSLECDESPFTTTVDRALYLRATRHTQRQKTKTSAQMSCATSRPKPPAGAAPLRERAGLSRPRHLEHDQRWSSEILSRSPASAPQSTCQGTGLLLLPIFLTR